MKKNHDSYNNIKGIKLSPKARLIAFGVFAVIFGGFVILRLTSEGIINLTYVFGHCGFKQRTGWPCPGCGMTHAAMEFSRGHFISAVKTQFAGTVICFVGSITAIFALLMSVFGIDFGLLRIIKTRIFIRYAIILTVIIIIIGWLVSLYKVLHEKGT